LEKEFDKLASLKKHLPLHTISVQDFETTYGLPKTDKNSYELKIPLDFAETDLIVVFGLTKGRKRRSRYVYSKCMDKEVF